MARLGGGQTPTPPCRSRVPGCHGRGAEPRAVPVPPGGPQLAALPVPVPALPSAALRAGAQLPLCRCQPSWDSEGPGPSSPLLQQGESGVPWGAATPGPLFFLKDKSWGLHCQQWWGSGASGSESGCLGSAQRHRRVAKPPGCHRSGAAVWSHSSPLPMAPPRLGKGTGLPALLEIAPSEQRAGLGPPARLGSLGDVGGGRARRGEKPPPMSLPLHRAAHGWDQPGLCWEGKSPFGKSGPERQPPVYFGSRVRAALSQAGTRPPVSVQPRLVSRCPSSLGTAGAALHDTKGHAVCHVEGG